MGQDPDKIHLIGHSLGAQVVSYMAKGIPGIGHLTGKQISLVSKTDFRNVCQPSIL